MARNIILFAIALLYINTCFSQQPVQRKNKLTQSVTERYHAIIGKNKEERQGEYQVLYHNKTTIVTGQYADDKKTGVWFYYNKAGRVMEKYEYDTNTLLFEAPEDTTSNFRYTVESKVEATDKATKPVKIGGRYFAYLPYLKAFRLPDGISTNNGRIIYTARIELLISPGGRLADFKIHFFSGLNGEEIIHINPDVLKDEDKIFYAATLNGQPITSRIFIQCYVNEYDELDMN